MHSPAEVTPGLVYVPELGPAGATVALSQPESHYVARVCRARPGDRVRATDGRGRLATLRLVELAPRVSARVEGVEERTRSRRAWVLSGAPEGQRADWLVEKLAELGVERWQPLQCRWSARGRLAGRPARWRRVAVAAMKQSLAPFLLEIGAPLPLEEALRSVPPDALRWLARRAGGRAPAAGAAGLAVVAVGPAPGFAVEEEEALLHGGFTPVRLAEGRLRVETAAVAWAAWWAAGGA